jgi:predicted RNase H-like HicB family nuclease
VSAVHSNRAAHTPQAIEIPILCNFWREDGVWNGEAVDLPVVVFGHSLEEAQKHLHNALLTHLDAEQQLGTIEKTIEYLRTRAKERCVSLEEMVPNRFLGRFNAALQDQRVMELV